uniref:Mediator of RNA polymerase II transcription subunit 24 n=1 Tax=Dromaius novaehollandiae TaxID=8790 RepID=A0A8C4P519_DRONO
MRVHGAGQAILQAWKERWSDFQWAVNMKRFFPRGATWDILNLAGEGGRPPRPPRGPEPPPHQTPFSCPPSRAFGTDLPSAGARCAAPV